jgi:rhombotail lipoprotein
MKATRSAVLALAFLATACTGTLIEGRADSVSSSLVEYLYPAGEKPPSASRKIPDLPLPLRIGIAFVPSPQGPSKDLSEAERFKLLYDLKTIFSKHDFIEEVAVIPEQYLKAGTGFAPLAQTADTYGLNAMALVSYDQVSVRATSSPLRYRTIVGVQTLTGDPAEIHNFVDTAVFDVATHQLLFRVPGVSSVQRQPAAADAGADAQASRHRGFDLAAADMATNLEKELDAIEKRIRTDGSLRQAISSGSLLRDTSRRRAPRWGASAGRRRATRPG